VAAEEIVGALAASAGLVEVGVKVRPAELVAGFALWRIARGPVTVALP
jgi:hypothetical protein